MVLITFISSITTKYTHSIVQVFRTYVKVSKPTPIHPIFGYGTFYNIYECTFLKVARHWYSMFLVTFWLPLGRFLGLFLSLLHLDWFLVHPRSTQVKFLKILSVSLEPSSTTTLAYIWTYSLKF